MRPSEKTLTLDEENFQRRVGVSKPVFEILRTKVDQFLTAEREFQPRKRRGRKSTLSVADQLLLTRTYLRHYPTFARVAEEFDISESYANKIFDRILDVLVKVLKFKNRKPLLESDLQTVVIDVTEQPIERPKNDQRDYYSGKKKAIRLRFS